MFNMFRNGFDYQPPGDLFRMRHYQPTTGGIMPPHMTGGQFNPMTGGNHPPMQAPQFNTGGSLQPQTFAPMTGGYLQPQMGGLAGLFRRGMY